MRNIVWSLSLLFAGMFVSFAQTNGIQKGTYLSTNKGGKIKLNLLDDNKYELVFYTGEYEIKGDSLVFSKNAQSENGFNLSFKNDKKAKKIKIKILDPTLYSVYIGPNFYIGTQKASETVQYQRISDIRAKVDPNWTSTDLEFEIDKTDFLYLVIENHDGKSNISKYALDKDVSEAAIDYQSQPLGNLNFAGFYDRKTNQLKVSEPLVNEPFVFVNEKDVQPDKTPKVVPLENQTITNWTYPGKSPYYDYYGTAVDSTQNNAIDSVAVDTTAYASTDYSYNFKLKIENNLKSALAATKDAKTKFLVGIVDSKNPSAKANFDAFIKSQESQTGYNMYDKYDAKYDVYNYYMAGADDKKWLKNNKITNDPSIFILNGNGDLLAVAKSDLISNQYQFSYNGSYYLKLLRADASMSIGKVLKNKKASDADLIQAFNKTAALQTSYDDDYTAYDSADLVISKPALDKKEVAQTWKKLIEAHQKDKNPDMSLAETIIKEIKNVGFTKQLFNEDRILDDTDFLAIDYLLKHSDEIESNRAAFNNDAPEVHYIDNVFSEISNALQGNLNVSKDGAGGEKNKDKVNSIYKKIIASGKGNFESYRNYFDYLGQFTDNDGSNTTYLKEFNTYFDNTLAGANPIEKLDVIFSGLDPNSSYSYDGWNSFKLYNSDICNNAAWMVVLKSQNSNFIKDAIKWSEYSLVISKNNPYYLDTLAQLYYKDGQKDKAIATETLAVQYLTDSVEEQTANDIKEVLSKMQNGTY
ncbi:hypothetical protein [Flavobacterium johnsoniae]|uniref:Uncharacterized protein n=1 Tax=Flavobacterium johnsoniae (strain ATCC 17061 / DSM 2064 / JCM 8514 / BCRC 14874 / CCUG 350202 / NBRC 14942 / NCIMB 11054 / UW101) TaxID=376686 RepID=A5FJV7_FLAJ1|nr:hypothetical protein [Flavobacterium johnsoniae]ABQ04519.1 hypothetical protein Fjoh_1487 [Flavobacterium johnsoniae UW101]OXE97843.1 hypothetical protein B0A63_17075 [Flavobacterium johnsoniae UW101]WQG83685.1 hypothetical protein SR927_11310 [Flavobacterium johnsoniae UW101]SHK24684.1 hypothetical protein SAMN05444146_0918 [Flavobacterium johnsoniae]